MGKEAWDKVVGTHITGTHSAKYLWKWMNGVWKKDRHTTLYCPVGSGEYVYYDWDQQVLK